MGKMIMIAFAVLLVCLSYGCKQAVGRHPDAVQSCDSLCKDAGFLFGDLTGLRSAHGRRYLRCKCVDYRNLKWNRWFEEQVEKKADVGEKR